MHGRSSYDDLFEQGLLLDAVWLEQHAQIATRFGPRRNGVRVLGQGPDTLELTVPYVTLPDRRAGYQPAEAEHATQKPDRLRLALPLSKQAAECDHEMED